MKSKLKSIVLLAVLSVNGLMAQTYEYPFRMNVCRMLFPVSLWKKKFS